MTEKYSVISKNFSCHSGAVYKNIHHVVVSVKHKVVLI